MATLQTASLWKISPKMYLAQVVFCQNEYIFSGKNWPKHLGLLLATAAPDSREVDDANSAMYSNVKTNCVIYIINNKWTPYAHSD
jgi:hypothetical protein